ncbi:mitogen-activated protein kinase kinase kinase 2 isoform X2 [Syngnathus typhle]|uniref:mitogen-activated protein kinase kinase kinase 2 isoform X2 n=1 Tax=Syngnathus typhle TaxID=161592 RepID=UPI002A6B3F67|nr:mitogen-activated protein kinase kinase kinase 2 isoform X2 [Syngnathus typhle]
MDEQEALQSIMQDLAELHRSSRPAGFLSDLCKPKASSPKNLNDVRVKFEFKGEKRILQFSRPVKLDDLREKAKVAFGQAMDLHYSNNELVIPLSVQDDLDKAVELLDRSVHMKSLKILLVVLSSSQNSSCNMGLLPSCEELDNTGFRVADKKSMLASSGSHSTDRSSPPPGYIPDALQQVARNGSFTSINSEGEFIPESMDQMLDPLSMSSPENSASGSCPSLDSPLDSEYPKSRMPRAQSYPDNHQDFPEYDIPVFDKSGKGGTYPRRYGVPFGLQDYSDGRKTFPRARRTQAQGLRSPVSISPTEQSPSTSSGSSVFTPDLEDGAGPARRPRRGSDIEANQSAGTPGLSVMDISPPSRSPRAPTNWRLGKLLGQGAFGRVFLCYDADTGRELAVKQSRNAFIVLVWSGAGGERVGVRNPAVEKPLPRAHCAVLRMSARLPGADALHLHGVHARRLHKGPSQVVRRTDGERDATLHQADPRGGFLPAQQHDCPQGYQRGQHPPRFGRKREAG